MAVDREAGFLAGVLKVLSVAVLTGLLAVLAFLSGFGLAYLRGAGPPRAAEAASSPRISLSPDQPGVFRVFWEAWDILERQFVGQLPGAEERTYAAIRGLVDAFGDPHTVFLNPQQSELERTELQGEFEGIGAQVTMQDGELVIVAPIKGSPAERAGIRSGDIVVAVDGRPIADLSLIDAVLLIRGPRGTRVELEIKRPGQPGTFSVQIVRDRIRIETVSHRMLEGSIGYVELALFSQDSVRELRAALQDLRDQGAVGLILDLRNNPGGFLHTAIEVTDQFLPGDQVIAYEVRGDGQEQAFRASQRGLGEDLPLVVLINQGSASASEIVAAAVKSNERGRLVGTPTFGKGSVQLTFTLSDGSTLHVTVAQWLTPDREQLTDNPLRPDVLVEVPEAAIQPGHDPQLERAIELLLRGSRPLPADPQPLLVRWLGAALRQLVPAGLAPSELSLAAELLPAFFARAWA